MLMQTKSATHYTDSMRAEMAARAGVNYGVAMLRSQAFQRTEDPTNAWYGVDYLHGACKRISFPDSPLIHDGADDDKDGVIDNPEEALLDRTKQQGYSVALNNSAGNPLSPKSPQCPDPASEPQYQPPSDRFTLNVSDAAGKINVNAGDNLGVILDNLCRVIGPPLVAANPDALQPRRWAVEMGAGDAAYNKYATTLNQNDTAANLDIYYALTDVSNNPPPAPPAKPNSPLRPIRDRATGKAIYGDGYAIAGYRARNGAFRNLADVKNALTYVERSNPANGTPDDALEQLEIEVKFAAIRDYITINSWVDTNTVCVGKFEWVHVDTTAGKTYAIDRDKSWVIDDLVNDPLNVRGSLRGCYLSIMNGHGAGQLRRIRSNGIDWLEVDSGFTVTPGPTSSYMIVSNEEAVLADINNGSTKYSYVGIPPNLPPVGTKTFPLTNLKDGTLVHDPNMDYSQHPLCIHRAPVNVNTASDKVLVALLLGINVQHGHPLALGTDADVELLRKKWKVIDPITHLDPYGVQPYVLTPAGLKRIPQATGKLVLNRLWTDDVAAKQVVRPPKVYDVNYLDNYGSLGAPNFDPNVKDQYTNVSGTMTDAHELAYRILMARQSDPALKYLDVPTPTNTTNTGNPTTKDTGVLRGPFKNYDDLFFRAIKPWDDMRLKNGTVGAVTDPNVVYHKAKLAPMLMANFNCKAGILKFNPNIEWIDRWGRNFTEQEPVMVYVTPNQSNPAPWPNNPPAPTPPNAYTVDVTAADPITDKSIPIYTCITDPQAHGWAGQCPPIKSGQRDKNNQPIAGAYITRNFRYKSDELIDKTDLNRSTTEFSFNSNGIFEIGSTGQVVKNGAVLAERKFAALVKIYDVWRESTQQQFVQGTISKAYSARGTTCSGQLARDASGLVEPKGLVTLPEPLLPLTARIVDQKGATNSQNAEVVSILGSNISGPLDAFGNARKNPYTGETGIAVPEVLANHILPARYDGQIALATNTSAYDPNGDKDCFLATFDGDLDTATCQGNGREQAKWPYSATYDSSGDPNYGGLRYTGEGYKYRCVQCIGLLGLLNDTLVASDPGLPQVDGTTPVKDPAQVRYVYPFYGVSPALLPLKLCDPKNPDSPYYWNNVTLRMGSLRTDGAYLSAPGVSGNNATLKYLFTTTGARTGSSDGSPPKLNFQPDSKTGTCVSMWAKTTWHANDMRNHEFFNPGNEAQIHWCGGYFLQKMGQYKWTCADETSGLDVCANRHELNDLFAMVGHDEGYAVGGSSNPWIFGSILDGGYSWVDAKKSPNESPGFRVQPFRWSFLGYRANYCSTHNESPFEGQGPRGHWNPGGSSGDGDNPKNQTINNYWVRPFIDTALYPEGQKTWKTDLFWSYRTGQLNLNYSSTGNPRDAEAGTPATPLVVGAGADNAWREGQDVKWDWADPYGKFAPDPNGSSYSLKSFGMNNLNYGNPCNKNNTPPCNTAYDASLTYGFGSAGLYWHYRHMPEDGTFAVIDELKISNKDTVVQDSGAVWNSDRVTRNRDDPLRPGEIYLSRYYLPPNPGTRAVPSAGGPPTFTSQTLLQSLKGFDKTKNGQNVAVVRVSWDVFTPRFMSEYKQPGKFSRAENITWNGSLTTPSVPFKGPFDYVKYNDDSYTDNPPNPTDRYYSVNRPSPADYLKYKNQPGWAQAGRGVEIELLKDAGEGAAPLGTMTFTDPTAINSLGTPAKPVWVLSNLLRYRVRFCYPVDPLVDPTGGNSNADGKPVVDPASQYLLDTPVFDDISITYIVPTRILDFHEVTE